MVDSVINAAFMQRPPSVPNDPAENASRAEALKAQVSNDSADALTEAAPSEIVQRPADTGLETGQALSDATYDPSAVAANPPGNGPPPPEARGPEGTVNTEALEALQSLVEGYDGTEMSDEDWQNVYSKLEESGFDVTSPFIDIRV